MKTLAAMAADMAAGSVNSMKATTSRGLPSWPGRLVPLLRVLRRDTPFMPPLIVPYCWKVLNSLSEVTFWGRCLTKMALTVSSAASAPEMSVESASAKGAVAAWFEAATGWLAAAGCGRRGWAAGASEVAAAEVAAAFS